MYKIYKIEDIHGKIYIGKTKLKISYRFNLHKENKNDDCSSRFLDLDFCIVNILEDNILKEDSKERERYYINHYDCVNIIKLNGRDKVKRKKYDLLRYPKQKEYILKNKDKINERTRIRYKCNKDEINERKRIRYKYQSSWGGSIKYDNNLLMINLNIFN